ncbi:MAG: FtsH protease activity modulator HflK [Proteobacteria bacterium]|nr:FtsH protease activity modulator HflK [Pseudomonadota bacterium]
MAWNEPGGGDKDPWNSSGNQSPPDLDEAFKKLQSQLSGIFGRTGGGGGDRGSRGAGISGGMLGLGLVVAILVYVALGIYQVDQAERGVVFRFGAAQDEVILPGVHWNPPVIDVVEKVNVSQVQSHQHQGLMLTEDENIVDISMTVQYVVENPVAWLVNVRDPKISLAHATESALRHVAGSSRMNQVITDGRAAIAVEVQERLQSYLDAYGTGINVSKVNIDQSAPPTQVRDAFNDVQKAKEDEQRIINEASAYAESVIPDARGDAQQQIEQANAYREQVVARAEGEAQRFEKLLGQYSLAKNVTRDRLYLDAMESVLSNSTKIMVDVEGGNNLMYLPLDRIMNQSQLDGDGISQDSVRNIADAIVREVNNRASTRPRDSR